MPNQEQEWVARVAFDVPYDGERKFLVRGEPIPEKLPDDPDVNFSYLKEYDLVVLSNSDEGIKAYDQYEAAQEAGDPEPSVAAKEQQAIDELHDEEYISSVAGDTEADVEEPPEGGPDLSPEDEADVLAELHDEEYVDSVAGEQGEIEYADPEDAPQTPEEEREALEDLHEDSAVIGEKEVDEDEESLERHGRDTFDSPLPPAITIGGSRVESSPGDDRLTGEAAGYESGGEAVSATDSARRTAADLGVDLTQVEGSGTDGRVTQRDVQQFASRQ